MELCSDRHQEVCFDGRKCPVCEAMDRAAEDAEYITTLENDVKELKFQLKEGN
jgi:hypothetical protein